MLTLCLLYLPTITKADILDDLSRLPGLKQGVAFSLADSQINYLSTIEIASYKGFSLEGGYAGRAQETGDKIVAVASYNILSMKDHTNIPILKYIEFRPGVYAGIGRITGSNEFDWGISATVLNLKF